VTRSKHRPNTESKHSTEPKRQAPERLKAWQTVCLVVLTALLACLLARFESLFALESAVRNLAATAHHASEKDLSQIVVVAISPNEYRDDFNSTSPLDPNKVIEDLIRIARAHPQVIAVDIDTSHKSYSRPRKGQKSPSARLYIEIRDWPEKFVWALPSDQKEDRTFAPSAVLGERPRPGSPLWKASGVTAFPIDADGYVRTYLRQFITNQGRLDSLPYALARRALPDKTFSALQPDDRKRLLSLWGRRLPGLSLDEPCIQTNRPPGTFLACSMTAALAEPATLRNKIVVVGGTYDSKDEYPTANGKLFGVQIIADALQTEAGGGGPVIFSASESMLAGAIIGTMLAVAYSTLGPLAGLSITLFAAAGLLLIFKYQPEFYGIGSLFPIPVVFLLLYLYHLLIEYQDKIIHRVHRTLRHERKHDPGH
jgi:CHASE2 domain-containing sensor protein